ncbi:MAG: SDR family oxidoreductase [Myxococcales bacterium]|nr:SDR family oxidoreductase [Myxococcales bacterium]
MSESILGLEDKVVVVTGSSQGVGLGCARQFARVGADVVLVGRRAEPLKAAAEELRAFGGEVLTVTADVTRQADIERMVADAMERFGRIDVAVNNVGGRRGKPEGTLLDSGRDYWEQTLDVNLTTVLACTQAFARAMMEKDTRGVIVNVASTTAYKATPHLAPYGAAKAGLLQLTKTLALELAPHGIRVVGVSPGMTDTDALREFMNGETIAARTKHLPAGRVGVPDDLGRVVVMLASELGAWVYGTTLVADGGELIAEGG